MGGSRIVMSESLIITSIEIIPVRLPMREPFAISYATYADVLSVLVRLRTANGAVGWGEATPDPQVTGETWGGVAETLRQELAPALLGHDARDRETAVRLLDTRVEYGPAAKAALDIALHDLVARAIGVPLWMLLGGRSKATLRIARVVSMVEPERMAEIAVGHLASGFSIIKLKVGEPEEIQLDVRRLAAVREAVGPTVPIKIDVNQGWRTSGVATAAIRAMAPSRPHYIEQPVAAWDLEGLAEVRRQTGTPIMVDEGCHGPRDMQRIIALRAADFVNIKLMKCGGLVNAWKLNAIAETAGIVAQVGTMVESAIASAAGLHLALALANVQTVEMGGPLWLAEDVADLISWYDRDQITVPDRPGLGIEPSEATIRRFSEAWWEVTV